MVTILFAVVSIFVFRFRSRAVLELKLVALEHQLAVLRRQRPGRPLLSSLDRLLWVLLYRIWPQIIDAMVVPTANPRWLTVAANRSIISGMGDLCRLIWCVVIGLFRSRAALHAENI